MWLRSRIWCNHPNCLNKRARPADVPGFCKSTTLKEVYKHGHTLTPRLLGQDRGPSG